MENTDENLNGIHEAVEALLTWYAKGQLDGDDLALVEKHLATCDQCQAELAIENRLAAELQVAVSDTVVPKQSEAWSKFREKLNERQDDLASPRLRKSMPRTLQRWRSSASAKPASSKLKWVAMAQTAALIAMAAFFLPGEFSQQDAEYQTLSAGTDTSARQGDIIVTFNQEVSEADMRAILSEAEARIVDGPMSNGSYLLAVDGDKRDDALSKLKSKNAVTFAEILDSRDAQ